MTPAKLIRQILRQKRSHSFLFVFFAFVCMIATDGFLTFFDVESEIMKWAIVAIVIVTYYIIITCIMNASDRKIRKTMYDRIDQETHDLAMSLYFHEVYDPKMIRPILEKLLALADKEENK